MTTPATRARTDLDAWYRTKPGAFDLVDVPEFGFAVIRGQGDPGGAAFTDAVQALYAVSYGAHFLVKRELGAAAKVMPLEALWWVGGLDAPDSTATALGQDFWSQVDRDRWCWQAMIMQPAPVDQRTIGRAVEQARAKKLAALGRLSYQRWAEGRCAQVLHLGPYADEGPSVDRLHAGIAAAGYRCRDRHHEIYLGDPRRTRPERLRTLLRQPIEPV
jgi:hypothetical protein